MTIVPYNPSLESAVLSFLQRNFPDSPLKADPRFFRWRFEQNPNGESAPNYFLAMEGDEIVGQMAAIRDRVLVRGQWHDCIWPLDLIIAPEHRGGLAAFRILRAVMKSTPLILAVGAGPDLLPAYTALGWRLRHVADTAFAVFRPESLLTLAGNEEGRVPFKPLLRSAGPVGRTFHRLRSALTCGDVQVTEELPDIEAIRSRVEPAIGVTTDRSQPVLDWKFTRRPHGRHYFLHAEGKGYAAVKLMQRGTARWGEVVDYLTAPDDAETFRQLMATAIRQSLRQDLDFLRLRVSLPAHLAAMPWPFWVIRNRHIIDDLFVYSKDAALVEALCSDSWHLTTIVSDRTDHGADEWAAEDTKHSPSQPRVHAGPETKIV